MDKQQFIGHLGLMSQHHSSILKLQKESDYYHDQLSKVTEFIRDNHNPFEHLIGKEFLLHQIDYASVLDKNKIRMELLSKMEKENSITFLQHDIPQLRYDQVDRKARPTDFRFEGVKDVDQGYHVYWTMFIEIQLKNSEAYGTIKYRVPIIDFVPNTL